MLTSRRAQRTIARETSVRGVSFLSGLDVELRFLPAQADSGITWVRTDLPGRPAVPSTIAHVVPRGRRTSIQQGDAVVEMVEHVMAALAGLEVDNCTIEIDGPETPGCDGSSLEFLEALASVGTVEQDRAKPAIVIDKPVTVREGAAALTAHPGETDRLCLTYSLDYGRESSIGAQSLCLEIDSETFRGQLAPSRTFLTDVEAAAMRQAGIGTRTTEADLLIFGPHGVIGNRLRFPDEPARHKMLDLLGDLALGGKDLIGHVVAHKSGHSLNAALVRKLLQGVESRRAAARAHGSPAPALDIRGIMKILPHRYPFLLVDRVVEVGPGNRVLAFKNVTNNEPFFQGHWPGRPIMPGVLIIEALAQTAGILISNRVTTPGLAALIASIDKVKLRKPVVPGDQLELEITEARIKDRSAAVQGIARVDGHLAAEARIRFVMIEADPR
ncbi:MAG: UDP-3-O-acyl-N-acetylglucosamine deacetylase [Isosphaeraceae bacterium]|nr:UDP-3-O-acyl-N-acetylglucosamine deacetylase [Isosphaeraceae bacterium]